MKAPLVRERNKKVITTRWLARRVRERGDSMSVRNSSIMAVRANVLGFGRNPFIRGSLYPCVMLHMQPMIRNRRIVI